jgi:hypothetical protein
MGYRFITVSVLVKRDVELSLSTDARQLMYILSMRDTMAEVDDSHDSHDSHGPRDSHD